MPRSGCRREPPARGPRARRPRRRSPGSAAANRARSTLRRECRHGVRGKEVVVGRACARRASRATTSGSSCSCPRIRRTGRRTRAASPACSPTPMAAPAASSPARAPAEEAPGLRPREDRDRRRPLADDRLGEPERALALQRHGNEPRLPRRALARDLRLRLWAEHLECPREELEGDPVAIVDERWRPSAPGRREAEAAVARVAALARLARPAERLPGRRLTSSA